MLVLIVELLLSRFEWFLMSTARDVNLYVEYKENTSLERVDEFLRTHDVSVTDLHITKSGASTQNPCAIFSLQLPRKLSHDKLMTAISSIEGVVSAEEL